MEENILLPGLTTLTFQASSAINTDNPPNLFTHISAATLKSQCPWTLRKTLLPNNPDRDVWLQSYDKEYNSLIAHNIFDVITYAEYHKLKPTCGKSLPIMCVNAVKPDDAGNPKRAKSRILVLGNQELSSWFKSD